MAYVNPRPLAIADRGTFVTCLMATTLAVYTVAGTTTPVVGDIVTFDSGGNHYVARAADNVTKRIGRVTKIELAPVSTSVGYLVVEWLDVVRFVSVDTDDQSTVTLLNSLIKDGSTAVANNFDAGATTGNIIAIAKSATSGAGTVLGAVCVL